MSSSQPDRIAAWLRERVSSAGARGLLIGMSGGVDSAVVARLSQIACPGATLGVLLPCHSDPQDESDAQLVADHFQIPTVRIDLAAPFDAFTQVLRRAVDELPAGMLHVGEVREDFRARVPLANIKPRLRMTSLYFVANSCHLLVAGTSNRSEAAIGYFTKYGDGGVDLLPIGHLVKSQVRALARELGVPGRVIDKPPSAGLWLGQTDEAEMGFTYADLEGYLRAGPDGVTPALALRIERLVRASEHKRQLAPTPDF